MPPHNGPLYLKTPKSSNYSTAKTVTQKKGRRLAFCQADLDVVFQNLADWANMEVHFEKLPKIPGSPVSKDSLVDFSEFDHNNVIIGRDEICQVNPHRFEMLLLDGILFLEEDRAVGFKDLTDDEFWIRGHFPDKPLMPGVLMCECAAQLSCYYAITKNLVDEGYVGLGGLESIRFRNPVVPGDRLTVMLRRGKVRRNVMFSAEFQGYVDESLVVDGVIKGVALGT